MNERPVKSKDPVHIGFEIALLFKGVDGLLEIIGGLLLLLLNPDRLGRLVRILTQHELSEDPKDIVANTLLNLSHTFSIGAQNFGVFYLLSHGVVKCVIIFLLWRRKPWAYPLSLFSLVLFIGYQVYRYCISGSAFLIALTLLDAVMIVLTYLEYRRIKNRLK